MKFGIIYLAISPSNKFYIGQTNKNFSLRKVEHLNSSKNKDHQLYNCKFYKAIRKHGFENFKWKILEENVPEELLNLKECEWIQGFNSYKGGYNSTLGGDAPMRGLKHSEETKKKMSLSHMGNKNHFFGKNHTQEAIQKQRESKLGKKHSKEQIEKITISTAKRQRDAKGRFI